MLVPTIVIPPPGPGDLVEGLLGDLDVDPGNDFRGPDGAVYENADDFGESWRVPPEESLFPTAQAVPALPIGGLVALGAALLPAGGLASSERGFGRPRG